MKTLLSIALALAAAGAAAQEGPPQGEGPWSVVITEISVVEAPVAAKGATSIIAVANTGEPKLLLLTFTTIEKCQDARNRALLPTQLTMPLGTGGGAAAHIGRTITECFRQ